MIDEVDKSDEEFESFLLEILSDYQVSIPEFGTVKARHIPTVVLTSNNFRDFGDASREGASTFTLTTLHLRGS